MSRKLLLIIVLGYLLPSFFSLEARTQNFSLSEQQIRDYAVRQQEPALSLLANLVNINSGTSNLAGVHQIGEILRPQFAALGFNSRWIEEPPLLHRAGMLLFERRSSQGPRIILIGHLDTVFPLASGFQHFQRQGELAKGPGIIDDKGGDIVILYALKALNEVHALDAATFIVALLGDEEDSGKPTSISRRPLQEIAAGSDIALDFEPSSLHSAVIARRGVTHWTIIASSQGGHSSAIFQKTIGDGAIFELARILNAIRVELGKTPYFSFNPGLSLGGSITRDDLLNSQGTAWGKQNMVAKTAMANGDFRFLTINQKQLLEQKMNFIVKQHLPGTTASIAFQDGAPAMSLTANNTKLLKQLSQVSSDLGYGALSPVNPNGRGAADIAYVANLVKSNLGGLGAGGAGMHSENETLSIRSLPIAILRTALLIYRLSHSES